MFSESMTSRDFRTSASDYLNHKNIARADRIMNMFKGLLKSKNTGKDFNRFLDPFAKSFDEHKS